MRKYAEQRSSTEERWARALSAHPVNEVEFRGTALDVLERYPYICCPTDALKLGFYWEHGNLKPAD
jgi:hypothetical protein